MKLPHPLERKCSGVFIFHTIITNLNTELHKAADTMNHEVRAMYSNQILRLKPSMI